ncbi:MAG: hypothetical protein FWH04_03730 [Oscillospiraceae bacterium]|nr:hypothetical protein [Oscillospiraceae bacterium]
MGSDVNEFLTKTRMNGYDLNIQDISETFVYGMREGLAGRKSSLRMLPAYIEPGRSVPKDKRVIVLDAGGTNFRVATLAFDESGTAKIENFQRYAMPGIKETITAREFFETVAEWIEPLLEISRTIGFCFSYPAQTTPGRDGVLLSMTKEVSITGAEGFAVGVEINKALVSRGQKPANFIVINDTVACMLGGMTAADGKYDGYIGFILGTGTNTCYIEKNENIRKLPSAVRKSGGSMVVNLESGNYNGIHQGSADEYLDQKSNDTGRQQLEKMVSGVYFGKILLRTVKEACQKPFNLFSSEFIKRLLMIDKFAMPDIDFFCENPNAGGFFDDLLCGNNNDKDVLMDIIDSLYERAARITAVQIAGILKQSGGGQIASRPVCVVAEGTFFYKSKTFRAKLDLIIKEFLPREMGLHAELTKVEDATLTGAAVAALSTDN